MPVNQPELRAYANQLQAWRFVVAAVVAIHQGPTIQPTVPNPTVTAGPHIRYYVPDANRYVVGSGNVGPDPQFDGTTQQATFPIPPVSQPADQWFGARAPAFLDRRRMTGPAPQFDGATTQDWFLYPVKPPEFRYYVNDPNRTALDSGNVGPDAQLDGATKQQTYVFAPNQPELAYQVPATRRVAQTGPTAQLLGVTVTTAQTYVFPPNEPEFGRFSAQQALRFVVDATRQQDQGATLQATFVFPPNQPELVGYAFRELVRLQGGPRAQIDQGATLQPSFVFGLGQPEPRYYVRNTVAETKTPILVPSVVGAQTYEFAPNQPERRAYLLLDLSRALGGPTTQVDGATAQATSIFPTNEPEFRYYVPQIARYLDTGRTPQVDGATKQATFIFAPNQPTPFAFAMLERARNLGGPAPQTTGAVVQATFIFPTNQPELVSYGVREIARRFGGSIAWPLDQVAPTGTARLVHFTSYAGSTTIRSFAGATSFTSWPGAVTFITRDS